MAIYIMNTSYGYEHGYRYGNGFVAGMLTFGFLIVLTFFIGLGLVMGNSGGRARIWGYIMMVIAVLMSIVALLFYSSTRTDLW